MIVLTEQSLRPELEENIAFNYEKGKELRQELNLAPYAWQSMLFPSELLLLPDNAPEICEISGYHSC